MVCLDTADLIFPQTTIMQPWRTNGLVCSCLVYLTPFYRFNFSCCLSTINFLAFFFQWRDDDIAIVYWTWSENGWKISKVKWEYFHRLNKVKMILQCEIYIRPISEMTRKAIITLQALPTQRYRRQAVKDDLDIVGSCWDISISECMLKYVKHLASVGRWDPQSVPRSEYIERRWIHLLFYNSTYWYITDEKGRIQADWEKSSKIQ